MPRKKTTKKMRETNGNQDQFQPTTLDQLFGDDGMSAYGTLNPTEYWNKLVSLNKTDLQKEANRCGLMQIDNPERLRKNLYKKFMSHRNQFVANSLQTQSKADPEQIDEETRRILSEGR